MEYSSSNYLQNLKETQTGWRTNPNTKYLSKEIIKIDKPYRLQ